MAQSSQALRLVRLDEDLVARCEPWFDDAETQRFLGDRNWLRRELRLIRDIPGQRFRGLLVVGRYGWVAFDGDEPVAFVGIEVYKNRKASGSLVVAPAERGRGISKAALTAVVDQPELEDVVEFLSDIEPANVASRRALEATGAVVAPILSSEGTLSVSFKRSRS